MDRNEFEKRAEERWGRHRKHREGGRKWVGLFLVIIGGLFLARASGILFPGWFFTWPVFLIGLGLFTGIRHGFKNFRGLLLIAIGGVFLADRLSPEFNLRPYLWPVVLIAAGLFFILRPKGRHCRRGGGYDDNSIATDSNNTIETTSSTTVPGNQWTDAMHDRTDVVDITAIFGGVKKNVLSKTFRGGDIVAFMGGAELNLTQADFTGKVIIDSFNMFGGTKLIIPPDWEVQSDIVTIFGGVDDKRPPAQHGANGKVIYLDGTCIFGGLEIRSY